MSLLSEKISVLIIDPDPASRQFLEQILHKQEYAVFQAADGHEGLRKVSENPPTLIACDANLPDLTVAEIIGKLKEEKRLASIPVVVLSTQSDLEEMEKFIAAGAAEYFAKSGMSALTFVKSIPRILTDAKKAQPTESLGFMFVFLSAKGGIGASTLAANIGMNTAKNMTQSRVAVVDMVLPIGSIAPIVGYHGDFNIVEVAEKTPETLSSDYFRQNLITPEHWLFHLLPGSPDPAKGNSLRADRIHDIIQTMRKAYDYVFVDLGRSLSRISMPLIQDANAVVLIVSPDVSTVELTKKTLDYIQAQGVKKERIFPILNRAVGLEGLSKVEVEKVLGLEVRMTIPYAMSNFTLANNYHMPITTKFPNDTFSMVLKQAAVEISQMAIRAQAAQR
jgi:MinD-like ATPase involved in chromosome partitioning or flagellar assembly